MRFSEKLRYLLQLSPRFLTAAVVFITVVAHGQEQGGTIYSGGKIITYKQSDGPEASITVEAVGTDEHGKIRFIGALNDVKSQMKGSYKQVDLKGMTLLPAFFDGHSHFVQVAYLPMFADLLPPPDGTVTSIDGIKRSLKAHRAKTGKMTVSLKDDEGIHRAWEVVLGNGYDDSRLADKTHPTRAQLDEVSSDLEKEYHKKEGDRILICVFHQSGHYSVCNTAALNAAGYFDADRGTKETPDPTGGTIYRDSDRRMTGLLGEKAHINMLLTVVPKIADQTLIDGLTLYTSQGFTTVEDGRVSPDILPRLDKLSNQFSVDVVAYPDLQIVKENFGKNIAVPATSHTYGAGKHFRTGGVKLTLDGSPQGRSAWLKKPYAIAPEGQKTGYYNGDRNIADKELNELLVWAYEKHLGQVLMHANGDASIDQLINAERNVQDVIRRRETKDGVPPSLDRRTVLVHGQFLRDHSIDPNEEDQIKAIDDLKVFPSLFPMHTFYWGDWYLQIVGPERANFISPTKAVQNANMMFSIHSDAPVTKPNSMRLLDSAVNRTTRDAITLGAGQRIKPIVALKAMTIWPAYQHFEEGTKGSIEAGKNADFVILSHNPLEIDSLNLICIQIRQTIKDGKPVYTNADTVKQSEDKYAACEQEQNYRRKKQL